MKQEIQAGYVVEVTLEKNKNTCFFGDERSDSKMFYGLTFNEASYIIEILQLFTRENYGGLYFSQGNKKLQYICNPILIELSNKLSMIESKYREPQHAVSPYFFQDRGLEMDCDILLYLGLYLVDRELFSYRLWQSLVAHDYSLLDSHE